MSCHFVAAAHDRTHPPGSPANRCSALNGALQAGDGQVGDENLSFRLRAQQDRDQEDRQAHDRNDEDRTRKGDLVGGDREPRKSE
jgi:hypothetical protein